MLSYPGYVHLGRALGGPLLNLIVAGLFYAGLPLLPSGIGYDIAARLVSVNLFFGLGALLPLPSVDGEVIWRELLRPLRKRRTPPSHGDTELR